MPSPRAQVIERAVREDRADLFHLLQRLVETESPSREPAGLTAIQALLAGELEQLGYRVRRLQDAFSGSCLLGAPRDRSRGAPVQVLVGHCDTVWPRGTLASMPITMRAGRMTGPGVYDMKGGLTVMVGALRALRSVGLPPEVTPVVFVNADEEIGNPSSRGMVRRLARVADRVLVLEPAFGRRGRLKTARKGVGQFTVKVRGKAAHAGLEPAKGVSAILELARLVQKLFALNDPERGITVNVGTIDGGLRSNVIAPESEASVDVRVMSMEQAEEITAAIFALQPESPGAVFEVEGGFALPPMERTPRNQALWRLARQAAEELDLRVGQCLAGGGSDGNVASLYAPTLDGLGPIGGGAHAAHEYVALESLIERAALLALLLLAPPMCWRDRGRPSAGE